MVKQLFFLLCIFPCFLLASEFEKLVVALPTQFKKEYWHQLDLYHSGNISFTYSSEKNKILHEIAENWQVQHICHLNTYNYNQEQYKIEKNEIFIDKYRKQQREINKKSKKEEYEQKDIISRLRQKIASKELDITLLKREVDIRSKRQDKDQESISKKNQLISEQELYIKKIQQIIDHCKINIEIMRRENKTILESIEQLINKYQKIIDAINETFKEKKVSLKIKKGLVISLDQFSKIVKKTNTESQELNCVVLFQSLLASLTTAEEITLKSLPENLTAYQYYIFSLGIFFRWYVDTKQSKKNGIDILLQQIICYYLDNKDEWIELYKKSYFAIMLDGLGRYETHCMLKLKLSDELEKLIRKMQAIENVLSLLYPVQNSTMFKSFYYEKKEKLNELISNIEQNAQQNLEEKNKST